MMRFKKVTILKILIPQIFVLKVREMERSFINRFTSNCSKCKYQIVYRMDKTLFFYDQEDYYDYKESKDIEGYTIISISKFTRNLELVKDVDIYSEIIDLSVLTEYISIQFVAEQIIEQFEDYPLFICDSSKRSKIEYELRFLFDEFTNIDKDSLVRKEFNKVEEIAENEIKKKHRKIIDLNDEELIFFFEDFSNKLYGHQKFKVDFAEQIRTFRIFNKLKEHKILSFF